MNYLNYKRIWLGYFLIYMSSADITMTLPRQEEEVGKIPEIDELLSTHGYHFLKEEGMHEIRRAIQILVDDLYYDPQYEQYYLEVMDMIIEKGIRIVRKEMRRLETMMEIISDQFDGGYVESTYAETKLQILDSFYRPMSRHMMTLSMEEISTLREEILYRQKIRESRLKSQNSETQKTAIKKQINSPVKFEKEEM